VNPGILSCVCVSALRGWFAVWKWDKKTFLMNNEKDLDLIIKHTAAKIRQKQFDEAVKLTINYIVGIVLCIAMMFSGNSTLAVLGLIGVVACGFIIVWIWKTVNETMK